MSGEIFRIFPDIFSFSVVIHMEAQKKAAQRTSAADASGRTRFKELFAMKAKKIALILLSLSLVFGTAACGNDSGNNTTADSGSSTTAADKGNTSVTASPTEIERKIADAVGKDNYLCDIDIEKDYLQNVYRLDLSQVESYVAKQNSIASVNPDTVIVLKVRDGYADAAVAAINEGYAQMVDYIRQYPFGTAKVLNARLYQFGNYVVYVISGASYDGEDSEAEAKLAAEEYAEIDEAVKSVFGTVPTNLAVVPEDNGNSGGFVYEEEDDDDIPMLGG